MTNRQTSNIDLIFIFLNFFYFISSLIIAKHAYNSTMNDSSSNHFDCFFSSLHPVQSLYIKPDSSRACTKIQSTYYSLPISYLFLPLTPYSVLHQQPTTYYLLPTTDKLFKFWQLNCFVSVAFKFVPI